MLMTVLWTGEAGVLLVPLPKPRGTFRLMRPMLLTLWLLASLPTFPQTADSSQPEGTISGTCVMNMGTIQRRYSVHLHDRCTFGIQGSTR